MEKYALWKGYNYDYAQYETEFTPAFPWNHEDGEDVPRYIKGEDGYWYNPSAAETKTALLSCTGDIMCEPMQHRACRYGNVSFFHSEFKFVRDTFKSSDFVVGNLETTVTASTPYAGEHHVIMGKYHCNAPESFLHALRYAGFDALVNANNHNLDSTVTGLAETLGALDRNGFAHTGTFRPSDTERVLLVKVNGIKIAVMSYSTKYNKLDANLTPLGKSVWLNAYDCSKMQQDVAHAKEKGAQFVVCYMHWGKEDVFDPIEDQVRFAQQLADAGVDYIVGSHSHCLQRYAKIQAKDGREVPCIYSLGNFVTGAANDVNKTSGILQLLLKDNGSKVQVQDYFIPGYVFTEIKSSAYAHVPLDGMLNGGLYNESIDRAKQFAADVVQNVTPLPTGVVTLGELCRVMGLQVPAGQEKQPVTRLCTDKENVTSGAVLFLKSAELTQRECRLITRENVAAVIGPENNELLPMILAENVAAAYEKASDLVRRKYPGKVILVTGTGSKTETKNMLCHILSAKGTVLTHADGPYIDTSVWQKFHPMHEYCVQELRQDHPFRQELLRTAHATLTVDTDSAVEPEVCTYPMDGRAMALAKDAARQLGFADDEITAALQTYRVQNYARVLENLDGITLVADMACKDFAPVLEAFNRQTGRKVAVIGELDLPTDYVEIAGNLTADLAVFCGKHGEEMAKAYKRECLCAHTERELEKALLSILKPGDVLLLCSGRKLPMNITIRKIFGITDELVPMVW